MSDLKAEGWRRRVVLGAAALLAAMGISIPSAPLAAGQEPAAKITRAEFASAYLRFETIMREAKLAEADEIRANREFDALTILFFTGNNREAVRKLDALAESIAADKLGEVRSGSVWMRLRLDPPVFVRGSGVPRLSIDRFYDPPSVPDGMQTTLRLAPESPREPIDIPLELAFEADGSIRRVAPLELPLREAPPGRYEVGLAMGPHHFPVGAWSVVSRPLAPRAAANSVRLDKIKSASPALVQAWNAVKARNGLLTDNPDPANTTRMLIDPEALAVQVEAEIADLERGADPFRNRTGDYWRIVRAGDRDIPVRIYNPFPVGPAAPSALVIAFHGAGGDENMFMDGYGAGAIKRLAEKRKFLLVTPLTDAFRGDETGPTFDALLAALGADYAIDPRRIFVLGHSAGGMLTNRLLTLRGDRIAAAACLCGFLGFPDGSRGIPRTLVVAGEIDPIAAPARIEPLFNKAREAGRPVEFRLIKNYGHTLTVARILPEVIDWLLGPGR
jgi:predicted esterase